LTPQPTWCDTPQFVASLGGSITAVGRAFTPKRGPGAHPHPHPKCQIYKTRHGLLFS
jgi:hypothetical protein